MFDFLEDIYNFGFFDVAHAKTLKQCDYEILSKSVIKAKYKKEEAFLYVFKVAGSVNDTLLVKDFVIEGIEFECGFFEYSFKYDIDVHGVMSGVDENAFLVEEVQKRLDSLGKSFYQYSRCFYIAASQELDKEAVIGLLKRLKLKATALSVEEIGFLVDHWLKGESLKANGSGILKDGKRNYLKLIFDGSECDAFVNLGLIKSPTEFFSICKVRNKVTDKRNNIVCKKHVLIDVTDMQGYSNDLEYFIRDFVELHKGCVFDVDSTSSFMDAMPGSTLFWFIPAFRHVAFHEERLDKIKINKVEREIESVRDAVDFLKIGLDCAGRAFNLHDMENCVVWRNLHAGRCMLLQEVHKELSFGKKVVIRDYESFTDYSVFSMFGMCIDCRGKGFKNEIIVGSHKIAIVDWKENISELKSSFGGDVFVIGCGLPHEVSLSEYNNSGLVDSLHIRVTSAGKGVGSDIDYCEAFGLGEGSFIRREGGGVIGLNLKTSDGDIEIPMSKLFAKLANANKSDIDIILSKVASGQKLLSIVDRQLADIFG